MKWEILNNFTIYTPTLPREMELDEICYTLKARNPEPVLLCTWKESIQAGCKETLHSLVFWEKASIHEKKRTGFFYFPLPMNVKLV